MELKCPIEEEHMLRGLSSNCTFMELKWVIMSKTSRGVV